MFEECVAPLVDGLFQGYNATVLAYGQVRHCHCHPIICFHPHPHVPPWTTMLGKMQKPAPHHVLLLLLLLLLPANPLFFSFPFLFTLAY
jgi:hypothetical protein